MTFDIRLAKFLRNLFRKGLAQGVEFLLRLVCAFGSGAEDAGIRKAGQRDGRDHALIAGEFVENRRIGPFAAQLVWRQFEDVEELSVVYTPRQCPGF